MTLSDTNEKYVYLPQVSVVLYYFFSLSVVCPPKTIVLIILTVRKKVVPLSVLKK